MVVVAIYIYLDLTPSTLASCLGLLLTKQNHHFTSGGKNNIVHSFWTCCVYTSYRTKDGRIVEVTDLQQQQYQHQHRHQYLILHEARGTNACTTRLTHVSRMISTWYHAFRFIQHLLALLSSLKNHRINQFLIELTHSSSMHQQHLRPTHSLPTFFVELTQHFIVKTDRATTAAAAVAAAGECGCWSCRAFGSARLSFGCCFHLANLAVACVRRGSSLLCFYGQLRESTNKRTNHSSAARVLNFCSAGFS